MIWCLPWYTPQSEIIKLKSCRNLIHHYLGDFLEKLTLDQLSVNLYNGTGTISDITLDCKALNILGSKKNWPVKITEGHIEDITITVPWSTLFKDGSIFKINGLSLTVETQTRAEPVISILNWIFTNWSAWSSSNQFLSSNQTQDERKEPNAGQEETFADIFESILKRLQITLENTTFKIEHTPKDIDQRIVLEINIKNIDCYDINIAEEIIQIEKDNTRMYLLNDYMKKKVKFEGITVHTNEFLETESVMHEDVLVENLKAFKNNKSETNKEVHDKTVDNMFYETDIIKQAVEANTIKDVIPENHTKQIKLTTKLKLCRLAVLLFAAMSGLMR